MRIAYHAALGVALSITLLVTILFLEVLVKKEQYSIAIMKAVGYTSLDIKGQYFVRSIVIGLLGIILGLILANTIGEMLSSILISWFGADSFQFEVNTIFTYLICPLLMIGSLLIATLFGTAQVGEINISENIKSKCRINSII